MRRALRQIGAIIAILFILFMNVGSFALQAHAAGDWDAPKWDAPKWEAPKWDAPKWDAPSWEAPTWEVEEWKLSEWNTPDWKQSEWKAPDWKQSEWKAPKWESPIGDGYSDPGGNGNIADPGLSVKPPDGTTTPTEKVGPTHPTLDKIGLQPGEPFFSFDELTSYSGAKLAKDIVEETIDFADNMVRNQHVVDYSSFGEFGKMSGEILYSGFKTFTEGDPTLESAANVYDLVTDGLDLKGQYDTFKLVNELNNAMEIGDVLAQQELTQALSGKTFTPANAIVSAITLPFTIKDTYDNVNKLNTSTSTEERTNTKWDLVGNAGELIAGSAAFVALIPGGQPIAMAMGIVGGALSLASLGHQIYRNRKKIGEDLKKKGKAIADGAKKTWGKIKSIFK